MGKLSEKMFGKFTLEDNNDSICLTFPPPNVPLYGIHIKNTRQYDAYSMGIDLPRHKGNM